MAFWQYPWHITVARLRRTSTGFPCSACSPQATKPICSFQAKEKATQADFCQCDRCSHILPSFHPFQGALRRSCMVGILTRTSQRTTPPALAPSLLRFYPNDQITPLRMRTFCAYSYGYSTGISPDSLISTSVNHRRVTPCSIYLLRNEFLCHTMYGAQEAKRMYRFRQVIPLTKADR